MRVSFLKKNKLVLLYAVALSALLFLLKWLELKFIIINNSLDIYIGAIAIIFTALGIWLAQKLTKPKVQIVEKEVYLTRNTDFVPDHQQIRSLGLSKREMEVLTLMAQGCSNQEIASQLFLSLATIKTHASRIFEKMDVKRRTQAIEKAQKAGLIP